MVKITNGVNVFEVTKGAFDGIYSRQGYVLVNDGTPKQEAPAVKDKTEDELFIEAVSEMPISQWGKETVKRFASIKGVDIAGTKNVNEAKEIIKKFLLSEE